MLTYQSSEGYRQKRLQNRAEKNLKLKNMMVKNEMSLKLKTDMNQNMKADKNLQLLQDEGCNVETIPYFSYVASHWEGVVAANPRLDGGLVQKRLWRNWWARELARNKKKGSGEETGKQNMKSDEVIKDLDSGDNVEEVMLVTVKTKPETVNTARHGSTSIIVPTKSEVNMIQGYSAGKSMKTDTKPWSEERPRDSGLKVKLPPGCSIVSTAKVEESNLPSKEMIVVKEGDNIAPGKPALLLLSPPKSAFQCFLASMTPLLPGVRREKIEEALAEKWKTLTETAKGVFEELAGEDRQR